MNTIIKIESYMSIPFERSFASHPKSEFWSDKNCTRPTKVMKSSGKKFFFDCSCGHVFESKLNNISSSNQWCPYCATPSKTLCPDIDCVLCFEKSFASHPKSKLWSSKNKLKPRQVFKNTASKYWFDCNNCSHTSETQLNCISQGQCLYCATPSKVLCSDPECKECFERSFASCTRSEFWSNTNKLKPREVFKNSSKKYWFNCNNCNHIFDLPLNTISRGCWCSYCATPPKRLCTDTSCKVCFDKSFASHFRSESWSKVNDINPRNVFKNSTAKYVFDCKECYHEFKVVVFSVSNGSWCPYCSGHQICDSESCDKCFKASFASHPRSEFWSDTNIVNPRQVMKCCHTKFMFNCEKCKNIFDMRLRNIACNNTWCPKCKHKTELKLFNWLNERFTDVKIQVKFDWSKTEKSYKRYDFSLNNILIELDGRQHFEQVSNWESPDITIENDELKNKIAIENGFHVIRICQQIVYNDAENWESKLLDAIKDLRKTREYQIIKIGSIYKTS
jgi:very-short-patch-repair endonuclease